MDGSTNSLDDVSAGSSAEFPDRLSLMEVRLQAQEDEITLLKSSLADALRKLRLHDQQIPLLKQQLIAVNPGAARVLNQSFCIDGYSKPCRHSTSSLDGLHHPVNSHVLHSAENGEGSTALSVPIAKSSTSESSTQTDPWTPEPTRTPLAPSKSLCLEDALPEGVSLMEEALNKLHQETQEEESTNEEEREKDRSWHSLVEDPIQPTNIRTLQQQHSKSSEESQGSAPQTPTSSSPAPPKEPSSSPHSGPLSPIMESEKILCVQTVDHTELILPCMLVLLLVLLVLTLTLNPALTLLQCQAVPPGGDSCPPRYSLTPSVLTACVCICTSVPDSYLFHIR